MLLTGAEGGAWVAARSIAHPALEIYQIGDGEIADANDLWTSAYGVAEDSAVLVRPRRLRRLAIRGRDDRPRGRAHRGIGQVLAAASPALAVAEA